MRAEPTLCLAVSLALEGVQGVISCRIRLLERFGGLLHGTDKFGVRLSYGARKLIQLQVQAPRTAILSEVVQVMDDGPSRWEKVEEDARVVADEDIHRGHEFI